jgi:hypothetical protein
MATYAELLAASGDTNLNQKMRVAVVIAAETIRTEVDTTPFHDNRLLWARAVFADPVREANRMLWSVLAQNKAATYTAIIAASDATVQSAVDASVNLFANGAV